MECGLGSGGRGGGAGRAGSGRGAGGAPTQWGGAAGRKQTNDRKWRGFTADGTLFFLSLDLIFFFEGFYIGFSSYLLLFYSIILS